MIDSMQFISLNSECHSYIDITQREHDMESISECFFFFTLIFQGVWFSMVSDRM